MVSRVLATVCAGFLVGAVMTGVGAAPALADDGGSQTPSHMPAPGPGLPKAKDVQGPWKFQPTYTTAKATEGKPGLGDTISSFGCTGGDQSWTVPPGVTSVVVTALGSDGEQGQGGTQTSGGGNGSQLTATVPVTPGQTYTIQVGCAGQGVAPTFGGWPDGGYADHGGNGGGSTSMWLGSAPSPGQRAIASNLALVAGGGGGGTSSTIDECFNPGGDGGNPTGQSAQSCTYGSGGSKTLTGGGGGTQISGGQVSQGCDTQAYSGAALQGGGSDNQGNGGGGGGGYYGGGAGCDNLGAYISSAGGGGSSWVTQKATNVSYAGGQSGNQGNLTISASNAWAECAGSPQAWTAPAGVTSVDVDAYGAAGSQGGSGGDGQPGVGAYVHATVPVTPGTTYYVKTGCSGSTTAPWPNGGQGAVEGNGLPWKCCSNGGGSTSLETSATSFTPMLVAGGGGGAGSAGGSYWPSNGGNGGAPNGDAGNNSPGNSSGAGGTQDGGGAGGSGGSCNTNGGSGSSGQGGSFSGSAASGDLGGGGGGYFGGGAGCDTSGFDTANGAGGGGSSWVMNGAQNVQYALAPQGVGVLVISPSNINTLTVNPSNYGTISDGGILNCVNMGGWNKGTCSGQYTAGSTVNLTATPNAGNSSFVSWTSGPCSGSTSTTCSVQISGSNTTTEVDGNFTVPSATLAVTVEGQGTVSDASGTMQCNSTSGSGFPLCTGTYPMNAFPVTLTMNPANGYLPSAWVSPGLSTTCGGSGSTCVVDEISPGTTGDITAMFSAESADYVKVLAPNGTVTVTPSGSGQPCTSSGTQACQLPYVAGQQIAMKAVPNPGYVFNRWAPTMTDRQAVACATPTSPTCTITVPTATSPTNLFVLAYFTPSSSATKSPAPAKSSSPPARK